MKAFFFFSLAFWSLQIFAKESFISFDFNDGEIENGVGDWYYSDVGEDPCNVYSGESQSKLCGKNKEKIYAYYNGANNNHIGWMRYGYIDSSNEFAVSGHSLKLQLTGGVFKNSKGKLVKVGVPAKAKSQRFIEPSITTKGTVPRTLPGDMSIYVKSATNTSRFAKFQGKNRFSVWVLMPYRSLDIKDYSSAKKQRPDQRLSWYPFLHTSKGGHYYHNASNIPMGGWTKVQFDAHPTHHNSGSKNRYSAFSAGGYAYPNEPEQYFNNIVTFALRTKFSSNLPVYSEYYFDEFEVEHVPFENEETINNIGVGFNPEDQRFDISFEDKYRCRECKATYNLKYSFEPITNLNFKNAHTPKKVINFNRTKNNTNGKIYKPNPGYNLIWAAIDLKKEHKNQLNDGRKIYFAVQDISKREGMTPQSVDLQTTNVPGLGQIKNVDLIKSIEYKIIPVIYPLQLETKVINEAIVGQKFEQKLKVLGGTRPYFYSASNLPEGLSLSTDGKLTGTPQIKENKEILITIIDSQNNLLNKTINLNVLDHKDFNVEFCKLIVDFKASEGQSNISDPRFNAIFKDKYTGFHNLGTTIRIGNNKNFDYQGVKGERFKLFAGDKVRLTWKNISSKAIRFAPRISFSQQNRYQYSRRNEWLQSSAIEVRPNQFGTSILKIKKTIDSNFINVNVNYSNNRSLILDKIEFVEHKNSHSDICEREFQTP
jgi:hypothetical protein